MRRTLLSVVLAIFCPAFYAALDVDLDAGFPSTVFCWLLPSSDCPKGSRWDRQSCKCVSDPSDLSDLKVTSQRPVCPARLCPTPMRLGARCAMYRRDENGCPTCECVCTELDQICPVNCPSGTEIVTASNGCRECRCRPAKTCSSDSPAACPNVCPFGRVVDANGCPTCECYRPRRRKACPPVMCHENCPYGTVMDTDNCPTCICKPKPVCPFRSCDNFCPNGRLQDSNGCDTCECRPIIRIESNARLRCPDIDSCKILCPNGQAKDKNGCPLCSCRTDKSRNIVFMSQDRIR